MAQFLFNTTWEDEMKTLMAIPLVAFAVSLALAGGARDACVRDAQARFGKP